MDKRVWDEMDEGTFDALLEESLPDEPPDSVAGGVTPWRTPLRRILVGLALNAVTFQFFGLQYCLPLAGILMELLGFRVLWRENRWFGGGWCLAWCQTVLRLVTLSVNATIWNETLYALPPLQALGYILFFLTLVKVACLWRGLRAVKEKAGLSGGSSGGVLLVWYGVLFVMAVTGLDGWLFGIPVLVSFALILRSLWKLSGALDEAGYGIRTAPVRLSDRTLVGLLLGVLAAGILCGYGCFQCYPMDWQPDRPAAGARVEAVKADLLALGFPADVLADLTEEEILACEGALRVVSDVHEFPFNDGRQVQEVLGDTVYHRTVYDRNELRITGVAVELPGEREQWQIFHHFVWTIDPGFWGTEAVKLWNAPRNNEGWSSGEVTGRLLYEKDGQTYTAPYYRLGQETHTYDSIFFGSHTSADVWAQFSLPREGENRRGYLTYTAREVQDGWIIDSWVDYTHQRSFFFQYPVRTAMEYRTANSFGGSGPFKTIQDALQFYPNDDPLEPLS